MMKENQETTQEIKDVVFEAISQNVLEDLRRTPKGSEALSMPICFLVKEQAKSLVALQELQKRVQLIEATQNDVVSSVADVQDFLSRECNARSQIFPRSNASNNSAESPHLFPPTMMAAQSLQFNPQGAQSPQLKFSPKFTAPLKETVLSSSVETDDVVGNMSSMQTKDAAPDSDKQDSGLDSDCRELGQESHPLASEIQFSRLISHANRKDSDELLDLLDEIMKKSEVLKQQVSFVEETSPPSSPEDVREHLEQLRLRNLLSNIKDERDGLKERLLNLASSTNELVIEKQALEQRFMSTMVEKQELETRVHGLKSLSLGGSVPEKKLCTGVMKPSCQIDGEILSSILKETNVLDLQKQVLMYMMENQVMRSKLEQVEQILTAKDIETECRERVFHDEVQFLSCENKHLKGCFEEQRLENASMTSRVRMLERMIQSLTLENQDLIEQLDSNGKDIAPSSGKVNRQRVSPHSVNNSVFSKQSASPAHYACEPGIMVNCTKSRLLSNASSFIDVTIEDPDISDGCLSAPHRNNPRKFSTPLSFGKKVEKQNFPDFISSSPIASGNKSVASSHKPNKRLTFNSMKTLATSGNFSFSSSGDTIRKKMLRSPNSNCDNSFKEAGCSTFHPLKSIQEKEPANIPFYALLEKLKSGSDLQGETLTSGSPSNKCSSSDRNENIVYPASPRNCCLNSSDTSRLENSPVQVKEKKAVSKNIHKRIQDILDRITAESDASAV